WIPPFHELVRGWTRMVSDGRFGRPLAFSCTVDSAEVPVTTEMCGPYLLAGADFHGGEVDTATIRRSAMRLTRAAPAGAALGRGSRSPYQESAGPGFRGNVGSTICAHYQFCRKAGDVQQAEALRAWALSVYKGDEFEWVARVLRNLPAQWAAEHRSPSGRR